MAILKNISTMKSRTRIILSALLLSLAACGTVQRSNDVELVAQNNYVGHTKADSVMLRDSIFIREKSDTVYYTKYRTIYKERLRVDTVVRCDTLYRDREVVVERVREVERGNSLYWKLPLVALVLLLLWRTGLWSALLDVTMKTIDLCKRVFRSKE